MKKILLNSIKVLFNLCMSFLAAIVTSVLFLVIALTLFDGINPKGAFYLVTTVCSASLVVYIAMGIWLVKKFKAKAYKYAIIGTGIALATYFTYEFIESPVDFSLFNVTYQCLNIIQPNSGIILAFILAGLGIYVGKKVNNKENKTPTWFKSK